MSIPDRPTLDGLEAKWDAVWERRAPTRSTAPRRASDVYSIDTPPPTVSGSLHVGSVFCYTHTDASRATSACAARRSSTRWAGTTTACRPSAASRTTTACAATRRCRTTRRSPPPEKPAPRTRCSISRRNFVELCQRLTAEDEKAFEELWRRSACRSTGRRPTRRSAPVSAAGVAARVPAQPRARRGVRGRGPDAVGRRLPHRGRAGRARGPRAAGRLPPDRVPQRPPATTSSSRPRGPSCCPPASRSSRTPTTSATSRCSARPSRRRCSASRCPSSPTTLADPEKGSGIAMICTFGDTTDVIWWRELDLPIRAIIGRDGRLAADRARAASPTARRTPSWPARP